MEDQYSKIGADIAQMLGVISEEVALIRQDNLARGQLIQSVRAYGSNEKGAGGENYWIVKYDRIRTPVLESDPTEYWGTLGIFAEEDFIAGAQQYPWMPQVISEPELLF